MLLSCNNISVSYSGVNVLSSVSFDVYSGDYLLIIGENGSGKTTLVKTILGINSQYSGDIFIHDDIKKYKIGYLSQQINSIDNFPASVFEIVLSGRIRNSIFYTKEDKNKANDILLRFNILHLKNKSFRSLSGGQKQRVLIARAIMASGKFLILDEPFNALDPIVSKDLYKILQKVNKEMNITIIMVSHSVKDAINYANKIIQLDKSIIFFGSKQEYISSIHYKKFVDGETID